MRERPVRYVREDLLHDGVVPVLAFGLEELERAVGEDGVVAPGSEQLVLSRCFLLVQVAYPPDDQPRSDRLSLLRGKRRVFRLCYPVVLHPVAQLIIPDRPGILDSRPGILRDGRDRGLDLGSIGTVTENSAPARRIAAITFAA